MPDSSLARASDQDGTYPRPQLVRPNWFDLSGEWAFAHDDEDAGLSSGWSAGSPALDRTIRVPFPPESSASGIGDTGFHPVVWYSREVTKSEIESSGLSSNNDRLLVHFGAVDYRATVWVDGRLAGAHEGGQTPFSFDVTDLVDLKAGFTIVVRAEDDPLDVTQPRGKQDWLEEPHVIWYHRTTGIWQPVWLESVPATRVASLAWMSDVPAATVDLELELAARPAAPVEVRIELSYDGELLARQSVSVSEPRSRFTVHIPKQKNGQGYESLLWSPRHPRLLDATVTISDGSRVVDEVASYLGLRSVAAEGGAFLLNDRPTFLRSVLEQGYWPESHLAAPSPAALREEVQLIKDLGFNAARVHEKVEDPRFLYWADKLGLLLWGEMGSTFEFSPTAIARVTREWTDVVLRDRSHPSIVTWVPLNESWGVQHIGTDTAQLNFARSLYHLTKALDPTRPVVSNDGWEHADSDLFTIHDYTTDGERFRSNYADADAIAALTAGSGPAGRRLVALAGTSTPEQPVMVTEFGGISFAPDAEIATWGYQTASSAKDFEKVLRTLFGALQSSPVLAGFCYTQLTDTLQEANGLTDENRKPKLPIATIREIVVGIPHST
jgi:beta-galactosidase/beta-glucuronidase